MEGQSFRMDPVPAIPSKGCDIRVSGLEMVHRQETARDEVRGQRCGSDHRGTPGRDQGIHFVEDRTVQISATSGSELQCRALPGHQPLRRSLLDDSKGGNHAPLEKRGYFSATWGPVRHRYGMDRRRTVPSSRVAAAVGRAAIGGIRRPEKVHTRAKQTGRMTVFTIPGVSASVRWIRIRSHLQAADFRPVRTVAARGTKPGRLERFVTGAPVAPCYAPHHPGSSPPVRFQRVEGPAPAETIPLSLNRSSALRGWRSLTAGPSRRTTISRRVSPSRARSSRARIFSCRSIGSLPPCGLRHVPIPAVRGESLARVMSLT